MRTPCKSTTQRAFTISLDFEVSKHAILFVFRTVSPLKLGRAGSTQRSDKDRNYLRTLVGQETYLKQHSVTSGQVELPDATAFWWILKDEPAITNNSGYIESAGHMAALHQDELYEVANARAGMSRLQQFGVRVRLSVCRYICAAEIHRSKACHHKYVSNVPSRP